MYKILMLAIAATIGFATLQPAYAKGPAYPVAFKGKPAQRPLTPHLLPVYGCVVGGACLNTMKEEVLNQQAKREDEKRLTEQLERDIQEMAEELRAGENWFLHQLFGK